MDILLITPFIPYPLSEGGKISQFAIIDYLRKLHNVTLLTVLNSSADSEYVNQLKDLWPDVKIESISMFQNIKLSSSQKLKFFLKRTINLFSKKQKEFSILPELDNPFHTTLPGIRKRELIDYINKIIVKNNFDIIQVDHTAFIDIAFALPNNIKKVFVHHEIKFARLLSSAGSDKLDNYYNYVINFVKNIELSFLKSYDAIFVFSEQDKHKLESLKLENVYTAPFPVLDEYFIPVNKHIEKIEKIIFLGGEEHAPNKDAVEWYIDDIAPILEKTSNLKLHVIGKWEEKTIKKYENNSSVIFTGFIDDIISYSKNSMMVVPVRVGSGIRTKILYAMAQGIPVISATVGCEGIPLENNTDILITDTAAGFANCIEKLENNIELYLTIATNAQNIVKNNYSQKTATETRIALYNDILLQPLNLK